MGLISLPLPRDAALRTALHRYAAPRNTTQRLTIGETKHMFNSNNPENARIIAKLQDALASIPIGGVISYAELKRVSKVDVQARRDLLARAQKKAEQQCGCIFAAVRCVGIKRLPADETAQIGAIAITGARRKTKRAIQRMVLVNSNSMNADARQNTALKLAHLQLIHGLADNRRTSTFAVPATADPYAARKATENL